jgi:hypothetical protein
MLASLAITERRFTIVGIPHARGEMQGTSLMDVESAKAFKARMEVVVSELSTALLIAEKGCSADELQGVKRSIGRLIADVDELLHESIYGDYPELNRLGA